MAIKTLNTSSVNLGTGESNGTPAIVWILGLAALAYVGYKIHEHLNQEKDDK